MGAVLAAGSDPARQRLRWRHHRPRRGHLPPEDRRSGRRQRRDGGPRCRLPHHARRRRRDHRRPGRRPGPARAGRCLAPARRAHGDRRRRAGETASGASGGGVLNAGELDVDRSTVTHNRAVRAGGGIEAEAGSRTTVDRSTLSGNTTGAGPGNGGGLHLTGAGTVHVDRSHVVHNMAAAEGGGLWNSSAGTMTVTRTTVSGNTASGDQAENGGGGLYNDGGSLTVERSKVEHNVADGEAGSGGGILNNGGTLVVERTALRGNDAQRAGGGIEAAAGDTTVSRSDITGNETGPNPGNGGGVHLGGDGVVRLDRSSVTRNQAAGEGGGLWNSEAGTFTVTRTDIRNNSAPVGPDVYQDGNGDGFTIDRQTVPAAGS
ncbi:right-handed parallel beta-helix repeat-containing protein [Blastococcus brunescens]|uniref:right-handed parallel beta-helix repeat-containing protein n=1 Tax=Blastococcus brunescens TaxID=1564165 RepID=UPI003BEEB769